MPGQESGGLGHRDRGCSQKRLTSSGRPATASFPGVFPAHLGAGPGPARPGGGHAAPPRPHSSQQEEKERGPARWASWPVGSPGRGRRDLGNPQRRLPACVSAGGGSAPRPGLSVLCKMRPLLRAGARADWGRGSRCAGRAERPARRPAQRGGDAKTPAFGARRRGLRGAGPDPGAGRGRHLGEVAPPRPLALPCAAAREREAAALGSSERPPAIAGRAEAETVLHSPPSPSESGPLQVPVCAHAQEPRRESDPSLRDPWRLALRLEVSEGRAQTWERTYSEGALPCPSPLTPWFPFPKLRN